MIDVLCVGHAVYDISLMLDGYPEENTKVKIDTSLEAGGGPASNAAYLLSKWGVCCAFAGLVGDDLYGNLVAEEFKAVSTDISLLEMRSNHPTPVSFILVNRSNGSRTIITRKDPDAVLKLNIEALRKMNPRVLLFDGHELEASLKAMEVFPQAITILDAGSLREGTKVLSEKVDYLVSSERFALSFTKLPDISSEINYKKCIDKLLDWNGKQVVVTLGERGLIYGSDGRVCHLPAYPAGTVDTTAAGDAFHGAFAYGVLKGLPLLEILKLSSMTAALSVAILGGRQSLPALENVLEALRQQEDYVTYV